MSMFGVPVHVHLTVSLSMSLPGALVKARVCDRVNVDVLIGALVPVWTSLYVPC
jgi:hypothetical protein